MNQLSSLGFGNDANVLHGYAQTANERLGAVDFQVENTGNIPLVFQLRQYDGTTSPSGFANVGASVTVAARGAKTVSYNLVTKRVGFFGSGVPATLTIGGISQFVTSTTANVTAVIRNKGDLRGAQIDLVATGRKGWAYDDGFARTELKKKWGSVNSGTGNIDPTVEGV